MKIDIVDCILEVLNRDTSVNIPGIGSLRIDKKNAAINGNFIHPPFRSIQLYDDEVPNISLEDCIKTKYSINQKAARDVINTFSKLVINKLVNFGKVRLPRVGEFRNAPNQKINFLEEQNVVNATRYLFPTLELPTVKAVEYAADTTIKQQKTQVVNVAKASAVIEGSGTTSVSKTNTSSQKEWSSSSQAYYEDERSSCLWPLFWLVLFLLLCLFGFKKCVDYANKNNPEGVGIVDSSTEGEASSDAETFNEGEDDQEGQSETSENSAINSDGETVDNSDAESGDNVKNNDFVYDPSKEYALEDLDKLPAEAFENGCVIIVGSFAKNRNVVRMYEKVSAMGYEPYKALASNGLTRVGLRLVCNRSNIVSEIQRVRNEFDSKSWYLLPRVKIETD